MRKWIVLGAMAVGWGWPRPGGPDLRAEPVERTLVGAEGSATRPLSLAACPPLTD